jgi:hypothetical protein
VLADPTGRRWYDMIQTGKGATAAMEMIIAFGGGKFPKSLMFLPGTAGYRSAWERTMKAADEANEPGRFTAFIGFEWTSTGQQQPTTTCLRDGGASQVSRSRLPPLGATTRAICGSGWRPTRRRPAATCSPSLITAIFPTAACSR